MRHELNVAEGAITRRNVPTLAIRENTERTRSCNACNAQCYDDWAGTKASVRPEDLYEVRICPNGYQTNVVCLCHDCLKELGKLIGQVTD